MDQHSLHNLHVVREMIEQRHADIESRKRILERLFDEGVVDHDTIVSLQSRLGIAYGLLVDGQIALATGNSARLTVDQWLRMAAERQTA